MVIPCQVILQIFKLQDVFICLVGVIYKISNSLNEKLYIGKTTEDPKKYWKYHKMYCRNGYDKVLYSAMRKYGVDKFQFNIIEFIECFNIKELNNKLFKLERKYIKKFNTMVPNGYNVTAGGQGLAGMKFSDKHREKISDKLTGRTFTKQHRRNISKASEGRISPNKGKNLSESHKTKLSKSMKGRYKGKKNPFYGKKHDKETRELISKKLSDGRLNGEKNPFYGKEHSKETLKKLSEIGKKRQSDPEIRRNNIKNQPNRKAIMVIDIKTNKILKKFLSLSQASRWVNKNTKYSGDRSYMTEIYKSKEKIAYGFKWKAVE